VSILSVKNHLKTYLIKKRKTGLKNLSEYNDFRGKWPVEIPDKFAVLTKTHHAFIRFGIHYGTKNLFPLAGALVVK
jgi:hypothetical protein